MPSQGSATRADGPPRGDTSSYPSMAGGREIEREREEGGGGCSAWRERREERKAMRRDKRERRNCRVRRHTCKTGHGQLPLCATVPLEGGG